MDLSTDGNKFLRKSKRLKLTPGFSSLMNGMAMVRESDALDPPQVRVKVVAVSRLQIFTLPEPDPPGVGKEAPFHSALSGEEEGVQDGTVTLLASQSIS